MPGEVLNMRLYDIMQMLGIQIQNNNTTTEYIEIEAVGQDTHKYNLQVTLTRCEK